jgi:hypothetical protein
LDSCYLDDDEPVCLDHATASRLSLTTCLLAGVSGRMLSAREVDFSGSVLTGPLLVPDANITGRFNCRDVRLTGGRGGYALGAWGIRVGGDVLLNGEFTAAGGVQLAGAEIGGQLNCHGAELTIISRFDEALSAHGMKVTGDVALQEARVAGLVQLAGADIGGQLNFRDAQLTHRDWNTDYALIADGIKVGGSVLLDHGNVLGYPGFTAAGTISLQSARIGGSVELREAALTGQGEGTWAGQRYVAFNAAEAQITGTLTWVPNGQVLGHVNLQGATVGQLEDDWSSGRDGGFWPTGGRLHLDGLTYGRFGGEHQATVEQRLDWIRSQYKPKPTGQETDTSDPPVKKRARDGTASFATQPYEQLAAVYRRAGQDTEARKVAIARRADLRKYGNLNPYRWLGNWLLDKTVKYGYQSWRAGVGLAAVFVIFAALSLAAQHNQLIRPVGSFKGAGPSATKCTSTYPCFYPIGYAVDTVIPILNVHQADNWRPDGSTPWGRAFVACTWGATGLGWALATLLVAGYTGLVRRD